MAQESDGVAVPGNRGLTPAQRTQRVAALFTPYHDAITGVIESRRRAGLVPALVSMHSFTPVMNGFERPWHVGILWKDDPRIPVPLMARLRLQRYDVAILFDWLAVFSNTFVAFWPQV